MKNRSKAMTFIYSFILSAAVMLMCTAVLAYILLKSGMGNGLVGISAAASAFGATLAGSIYAGKATNNPYSALITGATLIAALTFISLCTARSAFNIPFAVPAGCAAGCVIPFIALSKAPSGSRKRIKKLVKHR